MSTVDSIPLQILYDDTDGNTGSYKGDYLVINTKNPGNFERVYQDASAKMMKQFEHQIEDSMNDLVEGHNTTSARAIKDAA